MIFEIADGEQRRNSATAEGRCPTLTAFKRSGIWYLGSDITMITILVRHA